MDQTELLLKELTEAHGPSGYERDVFGIMARHLPASAALDQDNLGTLIAELPGKSKKPRVLVGSHLDEIGFMVKSIDKKGFLRFLPLGGWWGHVVLAQRVIIHGKNGPILGVVGSTPPHILPANERKKVLELKDMYIDVGCSKGFDVKKKLGIRVGDAITPVSTFDVMSNPKLYVSKAFDNRLSCALVCDTLTAFQKGNAPGTLIAVGTVQEEVGCRGAGTSAYHADPDVALIVDVQIAQDTPGLDGEDERLGGGVAIAAFDSGMIPHRGLFELVCSTAEKNKIPYFVTSMAGGTTDGALIHKSRRGVPTITFGVPMRYVHSHNGIFHRADYDHTLKLIKAVVKRLDAKTVASLIAGPGSKPSRRKAK